MSGAVPVSTHPDPVTQTCRPPCRIQPQPRSNPLKDPSFSRTRKLVPEGRAMTISTSSHPETARQMPSNTGQQSDDQFGVGLVCTHPPLCQDVSRIGNSRWPSSGQTPSNFVRAEDNTVTRHPADDGRRALPKTSTSGRKTFPVSDGIDPTVLPSFCNVSCAKSARTPPPGPRREGLGMPSIFIRERHFC